MGEGGRGPNWPGKFRRQEAGRANRWPRVHRGDSSRPVRSMPRGPCPTRLVRDAECRRTGKWQDGIPGRDAPLTPSHADRGKASRRTAAIAKRAVSGFLYEPRLAHAFTGLEAHPGVHLSLSSLSRRRTVNMALFHSHTLGGSVNYPCCGAALRTGPSWRRDEAPDRHDAATTRASAGRFIN